MLRAAKILTTKKRQPRRRPLSSSIQSSLFSIRHMQANGTSSVSLQPPTAFAWEHAASRRVDDSTNLAEHRTTAATTFFRAETSFHIGDGLVPPPEYSIRRFNESNGTSAGFYLVHPSGHLPIRNLRHPSARLTVQPVQSRNQQETKAGRPFLGIGQKRSRGSEMATVEVTFTFQKNSSTKISLSVVVIDSVGVDEIPQKKNRLVEIPVCSRSKRTRHPWPRQQISPPWPPLGQWAPESHQFPLNRSMAYSTYRPALRRRPRPFNRRSGCCMGENHPAVLKRRCPFPHRFRHL